MREKTSWPWVMILWLSLLTPTGAKAADTVILTADHWCPHTCDPESGRSGYMIDIARGLCPGRPQDPVPDPPLGQRTE
jgi:polar amino acid transport system substrate-binding protein